MAHTAKINKSLIVPSPRPCRPRLTKPAGSLKVTNGSIKKSISKPDQETLPKMWGYYGPKRGSNVEPSSRHFDAYSRSGHAAAHRPARPAVGPAATGQKPVSDAK